ncbi:hypothetical protein H7K28_15065 [Paenibacillus polymyxa]|jgi:hypothetical protein|uniref:DUF1281 family ferredoxin-like fold protein n=1 Tax=Paenibacillus polymyxa TaxID=1406 RepID=UPI001580509C|nr:hypothetical protein [Paenibacillus polymyxa]MBY0024529.1 hypothetical protein [Paenibacillus polymyxa]MBY0058657.1 hypothetical protein [Paenibacillus polymyxa]MBY0071243.1 hypothetical protein [Paenibacillus polymyxa]MBY0078601.1 hypothetical protein [Paenibacillus polymyxa]MBZ6441696.1 hypothetical protein [Paenibacillus polymyxa]
MPNHITNKVKVIGTDEQIQEVFEFIKNDTLGIGTIDFNKITPMPKWVYGNSPGIVGISFDDEKLWGVENTVLGWSRKHWGTKWNAYGQPDDRNSKDTIFFETAWNGIPNLIQKLAWIFSMVKIEYSFADEDTGSSNCGFYCFEYDKINEQREYELCSKEAYELAFELVHNGEMPDWYIFNPETNTYEHVEGD